NIPIPSPGDAEAAPFSGSLQRSPDSNCNFAGDDECDNNQNWSRADGGGKNNTANPSDNLLLSACAPQQGERSPPEGAEVGEGELGGSPAEDIGYASSSLSIDSPDSACGSAWDPPGDPPEVSEPPPEPLFPALAEAVQQLQEKERFKEREKEKHHVQLVMYRRLALLRWIHGLQQKVLEQQDRLQESFDTILDNRKELIRCMQHGAPCPAAAPSP
uniref:Chromosome 1 open reading frame 216 n=1 Tax=Coturnix japonica TaxID=93934 RepID=A0A8C2U3D6_COTJA